MGCLFLRRCKSTNCYTNEQKIIGKRHYSPIYGEYSSFPSSFSRTFCLYNYSLKANKYAEAREKNEKSRRKQKRDIYSKKTEKRRFCYTVLLSNVKIGLRLSKRLFEAVKWYKWPPQRRLMRTSNGHFHFVIWALWKYCIFVVLFCINMQFEDWQGTTIPLF